MKPPIPITDSRFVYVDSAHSDIRKTFERIRREQRSKPEAPANVQPIIRRKT